MDIEVDFEKQEVRGTNTLTMKAVTDTTEAIFDYWGLDILGVTDDAGNKLEYDATYKNAILGNALIVYFDSNAFV